MECKHCGASFEGDICPYCRCKAEKPEAYAEERDFSELKKNREYRQTKINPPVNDKKVQSIAFILVLVVGSVVLLGIVMTIISMLTFANNVFSNGIFTF